MRSLNVVLCNQGVFPSLQTSTSYSGLVEVNPPFTEVIVERQTETAFREFYLAFVLFEGSVSVSVFSNLKAEEIMQFKV